MERHLYNYSPSDKGTFKVMQPWILVVALAFAFSSSGYAQQVRGLNETLSTMRSSTDKSVNQEGASIHSILFNLQPTIYLSDSNVSRGSEVAPIRITSDVRSIHLINDAQFKTVEALIINVENERELQNLRFSGFDQLENLKYIHFQIAFEPSDIDSVRNKINTALEKNTTNKVKVFYTIASPN